MEHNNNYKSRMTSSLIEREKTIDKRQREKYDETVQKKQFNRDLFEKGTEWALTGHDLNEAGQLGDDISFRKGYARGLRLLMIQLQNQENEEQNNKPKTK